MFKTLLCIFILLHIIGDFYCQTDGISKRKHVQYRYVILHSLLYAAVFIAGSIAARSPLVVPTAAILSVLHYAVDSLKYLYVKYVNSPRKLSEPALYLIDQSLHLSLIVIAAAFIADKYYAVFPAAAGGTAVLRWACILLTVCKPANITIKQMLIKYRPALTDDDGSNNAGAFIGSLERIIITLLMSVGQYSAIGLVLTAKSVARYDKISKDQTFSEYYLLGTLLSTLFAIVVFLLVQ